MTGRAAARPAVGFSPRGWGVLVPALALLMYAPRADALPRYTAQYGQNCILCHANPTGGGLRSAYASQFIVPRELASSQGAAADGPVFDPEIAPGITVGADLRTLAWQREQGTGSVFSMQGDFYVEARPTGRIAAYLEQGQSGGGEVFAHLRVLPGDGYLKAGRFQPDYGWRFADHQMFNRRYLASRAGADDPRTAMGQGLEAGISPGPLTVTAAVLDGRPELGENYAARAMLQRRLGAVNAGVGASVLRRGLADGHSRAAGGFWYLSAGPVTWLGEVDETRLDGRLGNLAAQELTVRLVQGVDARVTFGFQDPDRAEHTGARRRYGLGVAWLPLPWVGLQAMGNYWNNDQGNDVADLDRYEGELMLHVFF